MMVKKADCPETVKKRLQIAGLFYPLDRNQKKKWAGRFRKGPETIAKSLKPLAEELDFRQKHIGSGCILWQDQRSESVECLFYIVDDPASFDRIRNVFTSIETYNPVFTYAIIHQKKEGKGTYDIFRLSKFSYLEHCNRVKCVK